MEKYDETRMDAALEKLLKRATDPVVPEGAEARLMLAIQCSRPTVECCALSAAREIAGLGHGPAPGRGPGPWRFISAPWIRLAPIFPGPSPMIFRPSFPIQFPSPAWMTPKAMQKVT